MKQGRSVEECVETCVLQIEDGCCGVGMYRTSEGEGEKKAKMKKDTEKKEEKKRTFILFQKIL